MKRTVQRFRLYLAGIALLIGGGIAWASTTGPNTWAEKLQSLVDTSMDGAAKVLETSKLMAAQSEEVAVFYGEYYFKTEYDADADGITETYYLGGANNWGTHAALIPNPVLWSMEQVGDNVYRLDSYQSNGGDNHYLGSNAYIDAAACNIYFSKDATDSTYTLSLEDGGSYLRFESMGCHNLPNLAWGGDSLEALKFTIVSSQAEIQPGDNVTYLIRNANFDTNNRWGGHRDYSQAWTVEANNQNLRGGEAPNTCAESWHSAFNIYQTLTNMPNGVYEMTVQAAVRDDSEDAQAAYNAGAATFASTDVPVAYINDATAAFIEMENVRYENYTIYRWGGDAYTSTFTPALNGSANMFGFSQMFAEGKYKLTIPVMVADNTITLGVLGTRTDMWAVFDNFTLTYLGTDDDFQQLQLERLLMRLQDLHAEAQELAADERLLEDMVAMLQDAIAGTTEVENTLEAYKEAIGVMEETVNAAKEFIASIPVIDDNHAYIFSCERSSLGIRGAALVAASYAYTSAPTAFAVINYESQNYLYSVEDRKFVKLTDDGTVAVLSNYDPQPVEISRWPDRRLQLMFNGLTFNVNGNGLYGYVINSWNNEDSGNAFTVEEVADFDPSEALAILKAAEQTPEAETTALTDVAQLSNNKVYSISGIRSKVWGVSRFGTVSPNPQYFPNEETEQFAILQDDGFYYLYSISAQQFLTADKTGSSVNQDFVLSDTPMPVEISSTGNEDYPFYFTFGDGWVVNFNGNSYRNHFTINSWSAMDDGNRYAISEVGDFEPSAKLLASLNLAPGEYVLQNVGSGLFLGAGNSWGTQASLIPSSQTHTIHLLEDGKYAIEGQVNNGGTSYWLGNDLYLDSYNPMTLTATKVGEQTFTLEYEGAFLGYNHQDTRVSMIEDSNSSDVQWRIVSTATALSEATQDNPINATFLIKDADFDRNNRWGGGYASDLGQAWTMVANNQNLCGGSNENRCAESWHSTFELTQTIVNAPRGLYKLTAQGFYRNDSEGSLRERPVLFANDISARFPEIKDTLLNGNSARIQGAAQMSDASTWFQNGDYPIGPLYIRLNEPGDITLGVRYLEPELLWACWDKFDLVYYGPDAEFPDDDIEVHKEMDVNVWSIPGASYESIQASIDMDEILEALRVDNLDDVEIAAILSDGSYDTSYQLGITDGWRNAAGDWQLWGDSACFYVKADFTLSENQFYAIGAYPGKSDVPVTYTVKYSFKIGQREVILSLHLNYEYTQEAMYEMALAELQDGDICRISTVYEGITYYLTEDGYLSDDSSQAGRFTLAILLGDEWEYGFRLKTINTFSNPANAASFNTGRLNTYPSTPRSNWESQVFFRNSDGQYAVRSTNAAYAESSWGLLGSTYWAVYEGEDGPTAGYSYNQNFIWQIEILDNELLGDANCDGSVDVVDVTTTVDFILQKSQPTDLQFQNTDVNKDQSIDVVDLTSIVSIILGTYQPADTGTTRAPALRLHNDDALLLNGTDIALRNSREYVAFQMDVTLADGAQLRGVQLSQRAEDHTVAYHMIGNNTYRILAYSLTGTPFTGSRGILLSLNIAGEQKMTVSNILFTDGTAAYTLGLNIATGISTANADTRKATVYDLQGRRAVSTAKGGVYVTDGKKVVIK